MNNNIFEKLSVPAGLYNKYYGGSSTIYNEYENEYENENENEPIYETDYETDNEDEKNENENILPTEIMLGLIDNVKLKSNLKTIEPKQRKTKKIYKYKNTNSNTNLKRGVTKKNKKVSSSFSLSPRNSNINNSSSKKKQSKKNSSSSLKKKKSHQHSGK